MQRDRDIIQDKINKLQSSTFVKDDIHILLITIRQYITNKKSTLLEICHFAGHSHRDKGYTFDIIKLKLDVAIKVFKIGGILAVKPFFDKDKIYKELELLLHKYKITFDNNQFILSKSLFFENLFDFLHNVEIDVNHPDIKLTRLESHVDRNKNYDLVFSTEFNKDIYGVVNVPKNVSIALPVF